MSSLQTSAKPILESLLSSIPTTLDTHQKQILANWAAMTTCVIDALDSITQGISAEERSALAQSEGKTPLSPQWFIWIGQISGIKWQLRYQHRGFSILRPTKIAVQPKGPNAQTTAICFGNIFIECAAGTGILNINRLDLMATCFADSFNMAPITYCGNTIFNWPRQRILGDDTADAAAAAFLAFGSKM